MKNHKVVLTIKRLTTGFNYIMHGVAIHLWFALAGSFPLVEIHGESEVVLGCREPNRPRCRHLGY